MSDQEYTRVQDALPYGFADTSYQAIGGVQGVKRLVASFYNLVETREEAKALRALYPADLTSSQEKLGRYLCRWLGGPKDYVPVHARRSITEKHEAFAITPELAKLWLTLMSRAIDGQKLSPKFSEYLKEQFRVTAKRIVARA